jgi:uncharacterized protein
MRLDDVDTSDVDVDDQRGRGGGGGFGFPMGGGGGGLGVGRGMGCGTIAIIILIALFSNGNLSGMLDSGGGAPTQPTQQSQMGAGKGCDADALSKQSCQVLALGNKTWAAEFTDGSYRAPRIAFYSGGGQSGCGAAQSAMGPFYCPADEGIYIDTSFYRDLQDRVAAKVQQAQERSSKAEGNRYQVAMELQADCYAGVWAAKNKERMEPGDIEEGFRAARAIGDDVLQRQSQGVVVPESFTHGSAEQRMTWLKRGMQTGDPEQCDTFRS